MWYQFSRDESELLIEAVLALRAARLKGRAAMPTFQGNFDSDLAALDSIYNRLYDAGRLDIPVGSDDKHLVW